MSAFTFSENAALQPEVGKIKVRLFPTQVHRLSCQLTAPPHKNPGSLTNEVLAVFVFVFSLHLIKRLPAARLAGLTAKRVSSGCC